MDCTRPESLVCFGANTLLALPGHSPACSPRALACIPCIRCLAMSRLADLPSLPLSHGCSRADDAILGLPPVKPAHLSDAAYVAQKCAFYTKLLGSSVVRTVTFVTFRRNPC